jgi:uncharacterized protein YbgA (DUF1722 family)/uncharacterized protein YbbK (DUF523 family)
MSDERAAERIRLGVSSCLLGENVRYDGGHKLDRYVRDTLGAHFEYVPVCPEKECGLPVPREAMHLTGDPESPRLVTVRSGTDHTDRMQRWGRTRLEELAELDLCGFIFKSRSPSSGMERIKVYDDRGNPSRTSTGIWARMFMDRFPLLPVEDEGRLHDPKLRERFIEHVFVYSRFRRMQRQGPDPGRLVEFHTRHKLLIMAHSPELYREMGRYVARAAQIPREELLPGYLRLLDRAMRTQATVRKNANVLFHLLGYFKDSLTSDEKQEFTEITERYRHGHVPLIVPITLVNHFVRKYGEPYLQRQVYLNPHPVELKLRNSA